MLKILVAIILKIAKLSKYLNTGLTEMAQAAACMHSPSVLWGMICLRPIKHIQLLFILI